METNQFVVFGKDNSSATTCPCGELSLVEGVPTWTHHHPSTNHNSPHGRVVALAILFWKRYYFDPIFYYFYFILSYFKNSQFGYEFLCSIFIIWCLWCSAILCHFQYRTLGCGLAKIITYGPHYTSILQLHVLCNVKGVVWSVFSQYILRDVMINYQFTINNHNYMTVS